MTPAEALAAYPFDPAFAGRADQLTGLAKLRAFEDPAMRKNVAELWANIAAKRPRPTGPKDSTPWDQKPASRALVAPKNWQDTDADDDEGRPL